MPNMRPTPHSISDTAPLRVHRRSDILTSSATIAVLALLAASGVALSGGCATGGPRGASASAPGAHAAWSAELEQVMRRQARNPDQRAKTAPPPAGAPDDLASPLTGEQRERALTPLPEALASLPGDAFPTDESSSDPQITDADELEAARLYVSGRARRLGGDYAGAERDLRQAARLDPRSAAIWREYGETQLSLGNQPLAHSAFRRAVSRDPADLRSLEALSKGAMERRDYEAAAGLLSRMQTLSPAEFDPAMPAIISARLGRALIEMGYLTAGAEALSIALALPDQFDQTTNYIPDLTNVYRQRGDLWREVGDGAFRLGQFDRAAEAYQRAASLPSLDPGATTARRVFAAMRLGQSAAAARLALAEVMEAGGRIDERRLDLLRSIAEGSSIDREMANAISRIGDSLDERERRLAAGALARAAAAVTSDEAARRILLARMAEAPADEATLRDLLARLDMNAPAQALQEVIVLTNAAPLQESRYARALVVTMGSTQPLLDAWPEVPVKIRESLGARLLHARLLSMAGDLAGANEELTLLAEANPDSAAVIVAHTSVLSRLGRYDEAMALLLALEGSADPGVLLARSLALEKLGDSDRALETLIPLLPPQSADADVETLLLAARLSLQTGRAQDAEAWLNQVIGIDPARDEAYAMLLAMYGSNGPLADERKLVETVRAMRDADPQSPTLRLLRAQESFARRQYDLADRELRAIAEENPDRADALHTLSQVWRASGALESGEQWVRAQIAARPGHAQLTLLLADVLVASNREREAAALLEDALQRAPGDDNAARALESTLRMIPGEEKRAEAMTEARLSRAPSSPETFIELIELALRRNDVKKAIEWAQEMDQLDRAFTPTLKNKCEQVAQAITGLAEKGRIDADAALVLFSELLKRIDQPQQPTLRGRIVLLILASAPVESIIEATDALAGADPGSRERVYTEVANALWRNGPAETGRKARPRDSVALLEHAGTTMDPPALPILTVWLLRVTPGFGAPVDMSNEDRLESVSRALARAKQSGMARDLIIDLAAQFPAEQGAVRPADLAQYFATLMDQRADEAMAESLLRVAISIDPGHVWANNNLGYRLLNEGRDLDEAHQMIERAYKAMKDDPTIEDRSSVTDSLGWARYKLGIIHDEPATETSPAREGAVTLLNRALELARKENDRLQRLRDLERQNREQEAALAIIADHYGDALWISGRREEAMAMWVEATTRAEHTVQRIDDSELPNPVIREEVEQALEGARTKLEAAKEDRPPATASMFRPANAPPPAVTPTEPPAMID